LRRTEYISSHQSRSRFDSATSRSLIDSSKGRSNRPARNLDKESVEYVKAQIEKSFQTAALLVKDKSRTQHPTKRNLKLVDSKILIPDLDAFPDAGGYITIKFLTNPVPPSTTYDIRLENSLLRPIAPSDAEEEARQIARDAYERDPVRNPPPNDSLEYEFFLTDTPEEAVNFKRKFDVLDSERDSASLYTTKNASGDGCFRFKRVRAYESATQVGNVNDKYDDEVLIAQHDGTDGGHQNAAYYYPILQRTSIRPQRMKNINKRMQFSQSAPEEEERETDFVDMVVEEPTEEQNATREAFKTHPYGNDNDGDEDGDGAATGNATSPALEKTAEDEGAKSD